MPDLTDFLSTIPIFSFLTKDDLSQLQDLFREETYGKGETICRLGEEGRTFYVVLSGELEVWGRGEDQPPTGRLGPRDFFGEMALLMGGKRTATITVSRRTRLLVLDQEHFESFFLKNSKALEYFARVLCQRLASVSRGEGVRRATTVVTVISLPGLKGKQLVASSLAVLLKEMIGEPVLLVKVRPGSVETDKSVAQLISDDLSTLPEQIREKLAGDSLEPATLHIATSVDKSADVYGERASNLVSKLTDSFPYMVFDLGSTPQALMDSVGQFSDILIEIVDDPDQSACTQPLPSLKRSKLVNLFNRNSKPLPISSCEPFVLPVDSSLADAGFSSRFVRENRKAPLSLPLHRMARKLLGSSVGLALGGGAAFGIAHLGVLKVLEENDVPIDLVSGCSQGSIIGVGYAAGVTTDEMIEIAKRLGRIGNVLKPLDFTLTQPGFLGGNRMIRIFSPYLKEKKTFEHLVLPCRTVATDIESGERVAIRSGRLDAAFRASAAVPMVFAPLKLDGRALVDGGVVDPVPAEVVRDMGADICIAVNVVPPLKRGVETVVSRAYRQLNRFNPLTYFGNSQSLPNLFDIIMNSMQVLQYELGNFKAISADVRINPDLSDFTWIEYYRAEELIQRGREATERALPAIQKVLQEKLSRARRTIRPEAQGEAQIDD